MRGRKPKPIAQQIAEGDPRKKGVHKLDEQLSAEPKAMRGLPECPKHLKGRARRAWNFWREELEAMNLDHRPDAIMLEGACVGYARAVDADLLIAQHGIVLAEPIYREGVRVGAKARNNPAIATSNAAWKQVRAFCSEFGLSPVSRTRLAIEKADSGEADLTKLLAQPRASKQTSIQ